MTNKVWEVNIATGAIEKTWNVACDATCFLGLSVFGWSTHSPPTAPEPASLALLDSGLAVLRLARRQERKAL